MDKTDGQPRIAQVYPISRRNHMGGCLKMGQSEQKGFKEALFLTILEIDFTVLPFYLSLVLLCCTRDSKLLSYHSKLEELGFLEPSCCDLSPSNWGLGFSSPIVGCSHPAAMRSHARAKQTSGAGHHGYTMAAIAIAEHHPPLQNHQGALVYLGAIPDAAIVFAMLTSGESAGQ